MFKGHFPNGGAKAVIESTLAPPKKRASLIPGMLETITSILLVKSMYKYLETA